MNKRRTPESELVSVCLRWLRMSRIFAWRNNTGVLLDRTGRPVLFGLKGSSDILGVLPPNGRMFGVECKVNRPVTVEQQAFLDEINHAGGLAVVVRSLNELIAEIEGAQHAE